MQAQIAAKQDAILATYRAELPTYADQLKRNLGSIEGDFQNRGLYESGGRLAGEAQERVTNANEVNKLTTGLQNNQIDLEHQLMSGIASENEKQAEQGLVARTNVALSSNASSGNPTAGTSRTPGLSNVTGP